MTRLRIVRESPAAIEARALETIDRNLRNIAQHGPKLNDRGWYLCATAVISSLGDLEHIGRTAGRALQYARYRAANRCLDIKVGLLSGCGVNDDRGTHISFDYGRDRWVNS